MDDPSQWNETELDTYLQECGIDVSLHPHVLKIVISQVLLFAIQNIHMMERDEKAALIFSLLESNPAVAMTEDTSESRGDFFNTGNLGFESTTSEAIKGEELDFKGESHQKMEDARAAAAERDAEHYDEAITQVSDITGCNAEESRHLLEAVGWDIEAAINLHMGHDVTFPTPSIAASGPPSIRPDYADVDFEMPQRFQPFEPGPLGPFGVGGVGFRGPLGGRPDDLFRELMSHRIVGYGGGGDVDVGAEAAPAQDEYDEEGIRRPDPVKLQRLMSIGTEADAVLGRADAPGVDWMFPPPSHVSYPGPLQEAREMAKMEQKWILVNIQSHEEFASHMLNRDTWVDETVISLLRTKFLLWQRGHTSADGVGYMRLHNITNNDLPHIAILDPRTGGRIVTVKGFIGHDELSMTLLEFLDDNSFENSRAPKNRFIGGTDLSKFDRKSAAEDYDVDDCEDIVEGAQDREEARGAGIGRKERSEKSLQEGKTPQVGLTSAVASSSSTSHSSLKLPQPPQETKAAVRLDFGPISPEPPVDDPNIAKISIKLTTGKNVIRRFLKTDPVRSIYAYTLSVTPEASAESREFDIVTSYPQKSLKGSLDMTVGDAGLAGSQVIMRWI